MMFFDQQYIESLREKEKTGKLSKVARPAFRLATYPEWQNLRDSVDKLFEKLPNDSQARLRKKRNDLQNIWQIVNEIRVGFYLINEGHKIEHEKKIDNLTPDWFATAKNNRNFIVEVFTKTVSDKNKLESEYLTDLRTLSKNIPIGVWVYIKPREKNKEIAWSDELITQIVSELEDWLKSAPSPGSKKEIKDLEFEFWTYSAKIKYVCYAIANKAFAVNPIPVKSNIEIKVEKYKDICNNNNLPLVVACLPDFSTAIGKEEFEYFCNDLFNDYPNLTSIWAFIDNEVEIFDNPKALFLIK